ncbi:uncharacterized protein LOC134582656 [Pelobates fuscus]|uniref:uncharacterized protein LOC134582656 n=1 Tax=Pelobates fuscus TaxID=191477 RepID=UPI002FE43B29
MGRKNKKPKGDRSPTSRDIGELLRGAQRAAWNKMALKGDETSYSSGDNPFDMGEEIPHNAPKRPTIPQQASTEPVTAAQLKDMLAELRTNIAADMADFKTAVEKATSRITLLEATTSTQDSRLTVVENQIAEISKLQLLTTDRMDAMEDQKRRYNLKLRGVPDSIDLADLPHYIRRLFSTLLPPKQAKTVRLDGLFRLPKPPTAPMSATADLIIRFQSMSDKALLLQAIKGKTPLCFEGSSLTTFPDLTRNTIAWRRSLRPLLQLLQSQNIPYRWGTPRQLMFTHLNTAYKARSYAELDAFMGKLGITGAKSVAGILCTVSCGNKRTVIGEVGGDVILPVNQTGIKDASWVFVNGGTHFATTKPDGDIDIRDNRYEGRLDGTTDGSLKFTKLIREDQREYKANIRTDPGNKQCEQQYNLRVFKKIQPEDLEILPNVTINGTCTVTLSCKVNVNGSDVNITWRSPDGSNINEINGSLRVSDTNISYTCTAQNPVSNAFKTVIPQTYCNKENGSTGNKQSQLRNTAVIAPPLAIGAVAFIGVGVLMANRKNRKKREIEAEELATTTYVEVQQKQQTQNVIPENSGQQNNATAQTLYSEVQHPKKPEKPQQERVNNSEQNIKPEKNDVNTLYSVINSVKHKQEDSKETTVYDTIK